MVRANRFCESLLCSASACIGRAGGADQLEIASCVDRASLGTRIETLSTGTGTGTGTGKFWIYKKTCKYIPVLEREWI